MLATGSFSEDVVAPRSSGEDVDVGANSEDGDVGLRVSFAVKNTFITIPDEDGSPRVTRQRARTDGDVSLTSEDADDGLGVTLAAQNSFTSVASRQ